VDGVADEVDGAERMTGHGRSVREPRPGGAAAPVRGWRPSIRPSRSR
jgi:hypothetical protein